MENNDIIKKAIVKLQCDVLSSKLPDNEKQAIKALLEKLDVYYDKKLKQAYKKGNNSDKAIVLQSFITDILVEINSLLTQDSDIYYFVSIVNQKLQDKKIDKLVINNKK